MTTEKVSDLEIVSLKSFFDAGKFRLIPADVVHFSGGISEVPVEFNLHSDFAKRLKFDTRNLQTLYGFGRIEKELIAINQGDYYSPARKGRLRAVELNDCGELWILKFEFFDLMIKLYAVRPAEVEELLNECRKPAMLDYAIL